MVILYDNSSIVLELWQVEVMTELISMEISSIKQSGDQGLSPDVPFPRTCPEHPKTNLNNLIPSQQILNQWNTL